MLILSRRVGESIVVGDNIIIKISSLNGQQVKMGVEAPRSISVHREEVFRRICEKKTGEERSVLGLRYKDH